MQQYTDLKSSVKRHWENETCGTRYGHEIEKKRYDLEPYILDFADFADAKGKKVLEIGVGAGVDFANWIRYGAIATGIDLTDAAIKMTRERLATPHPRLLTADAENLPFPGGEFDIVYSWGVLHHTPDTKKAFNEAFRVLKPGGKLKAMIYHAPSWTGFLLWVRYCLLKGKLFKSAKKAISEHLESPGTKAYTISEARKMLAKIGFTNIHLQTRLCAGDLLTIKPSKKYQHFIYKIIWKLYPRWFVRMLGDRFGLEMLITAKKS